MSYREHNIAYYVEISLEERRMGVFFLLICFASVILSFIRVGVEKVKGQVSMDELE